MATTPTTDRLRAAFLDTVEVAAGVLGLPEVAARWDGPSALRLLSVRGLAGHLLRGATTVEGYLDGPEPAGAEPISATDYVSRATGAGDDITSEHHTAIRDRGEAQAAAGPAGVAAEAAAVCTRLRERLAAEPEGRLVAVFAGTAMTLDEYLRTRLVELTLHIDDLCVSVGVPTPELPADAAGAAIETLVGVARRRHGDSAVLAALARRERDDGAALRVI